MENVMQFDHVSLVYQSLENETCAVEDLTFSVREGEFVAIVGPSGCGKSSVLSIAAGLIKPSGGSVLLEGEKVEGPSRAIGYMLQRDYLFEWRTIAQNARIGLEIRHEASEAAIARVTRLLKTCGLYEFRNQRPSQLSGGMRQRAALIRTLAINPRILLLDEPFSALDYQTRLALCEELSAIIRREKKTALFVTHDIAEAISIADRVLVLTQRPSTLKLDIPIRLNAPSPLARRNEPAFQGYFDQIWKEMDVHVG